jgi:hypothetical protein
MHSFHRNHSHCKLAGTGVHDTPSLAFELHDPRHSTNRAQRMMNVRDFEYCPALITLQRGPNVGYDLSYPT